MGVLEVDSDFDLHNPRRPPYGAGTRISYPEQSSRKSIEVSGYVLVAGVVTCTYNGQVNMGGYRSVPLSDVRKVSRIYNGCPPLVVGVCNRVGVAEAYAIAGGDLRQQH